MYFLNLLTKISRMTYHIQGLYRCSCFLIEAVVNVTTADIPDDGQEL
jgi:hypothetical protein